jgi:ParB family chromosome partitioning protein
VLTLDPVLASAGALAAGAASELVRGGPRHGQILAPKGKAKKKAAARDANIESLERELAETRVAKVSIQHGRGGRGRLVIAPTTPATN